MAVEHLSPEDATLWCAQAADAPLQIGGMALIEAAALRDESGAIPIDRIRRHLEARLSSVPRFRQTLRSVPLGQGLVWVDDEHFDIARHMRLVSLPHPGSEDQLREFVARLLETPLRPDRPLWEFWVVEGVAGDRVALVPKISHVLGDGMAILTFVLSVFDLEPLIHDDVPPPWVHSPPVARLSMLVAALGERGRRQTRAVWALARALADPTRLPERVGAVVRGAEGLLSSAPALPFTRPVGPRRDFAWVRLPLADLEAVKRAEGVKLNDVILTVITAGVSTYLEQRGSHADRLRVVVPVSTHGVNPAGEFENRFTMMFVNLAEAADPIDRLRAVHAETTRGKESMQTSLGATVLAAGGLLPQWLLRSLAPRLLHHQPFVNIVVTNLTGSRQPMYLFGARILEMYPFITVTANLTVMFGVVSYDDTLGVGITVDADAVPDVTDLADAVAQAADQLVGAARASVPAG